MRKSFLSLIILMFALIATAQDIDFEFLNTNLPIEDRVDILVSQMTLEE